MGVCTKERKGVTAEVLRATPCPMPLQPATCTTQQSLLAFTPDSVMVVVASDNDEHDRLCHHLPPPALPRPYSSFLTGFCRPWHRGRNGAGRLFDWILMMKVYLSLLLEVPPSVTGPDESLRVTATTVAARLAPAKGHRWLVTSRRAWAASCRSSRLGCCCQMPCIAFSRRARCLWRERACLACSLATASAPAPLSCPTSTGRRADALKISFWVTGASLGQWDKLLRSYGRRAL